MFSRSRLLAIGGAAALATLLLTSTAAFGGDRASSPRGAVAARSVSAAPHVLGYGGQTSGPRKKNLFGIFATGSGNVASGAMSFYAGSPLKLVTATIRCLVVSGNDAIATGDAVINSTQQVVVAELVDLNDPSDQANPDLLRFSFDPFIRPDPDNPGCYLPTLAPTAIRSGDVRVVPGA